MKKNFKSSSPSWYIHQLGDCFQKIIYYIFFYVLLLEKVQWNMEPHNWNTYFTIVKWMKREKIVNGEEEEIK